MVLHSICTRPSPLTALGEPATDRSALITVKAGVVADDHTYRWVKTKTFRLGNETATAALDALVTDARYRDHYTSPDSETDAAIHGPYRLEAVTVEAFYEVTPETARREIQEWLDLYGPVQPEEIHGDWAFMETRLTSATDIYRLRDLGESALHEFGWILRDFREFVAVDTNSLQLHLVVAAGD